MVSSTKQVPTADPTQIKQTLSQNLDKWKTLNQVQSDNQAGASKDTLEQDITSGYKQYTSDGGQESLSAFATDVQAASGLSSDDIKQLVAATNAASSSTEALHEIGVGDGDGGP